MITVEDVLVGQDERKEFWPPKYSDNPLSVTYRKLRDALYGYPSRLHCIKSHHNGREHQYSKNMVIGYQASRILKTLNNKDYIYLTPTQLRIPQLSHHADGKHAEYVAILKWPGVIGYSMLILSFNKRSYGFSDPEYEEFGGYCCLMEVLHDGTTILFDRTMPWDKVKNCRVNTTAIRNLFFTENEIRVIGLKIDGIVNSPASEPNEIYKCYIDEDRLG